MRIHSVERNGDDVIEVTITEMARQCHRGEVSLHNQCVT